MNLFKRDDTHTPAYADGTPVAVGDWVTAGPDAPSHSHLTNGAAVGQVNHIYDDSNEISVVLYSKTGRVINSGFYVYAKYVAKTDEPTFQAVLADVPNTPEVQEVKDRVYREAMALAKRHNMCNVVKNALEDLGIDRPDGGKVTATISITVTANVDDVLADSDVTTFATKFEENGNRDKVTLLNRHAKDENVTVTYEVIPNRPTPAGDNTPTVETPAPAAG